MRQTSLFSATIPPQIETLIQWAMKNPETVEIGIRRSPAETVKHVVYPGLSKSGYLRRSAKVGPTVITYHGVLPKGYEARDLALDGHLITSETFACQVQLLKREYNVIAPEQFLLWIEILSKEIRLSHNISL